MAPNSTGLKLNTTVIERKSILWDLGEIIQELNVEIVTALTRDLGKKRPEVELTEIKPVVDELEYALQGT